ncbi:hypothetical protein SteCoe_31985 [Stentor coeruleus]|uniref:UBC core domain-containing protein n=1 Tax=Stentor coeruleus TaxID=5963 RepID=A0A1R2AZZ4_9CILI|nr:hypothetical protein SteCoe_31985 [Stentor coeruleus]
MSVSMDQLFNNLQAAGYDIEDIFKAMEGTQDQDLIIRRLEEQKMKKENPSSNPSTQPSHSPNLSGFQSSGGINPQNISSFEGSQSTGLFQSGGGFQMSGGLSSMGGIQSGGFQSFDNPNFGDLSGGLGGGIASIGGLGGGGITSLNSGFSNVGGITSLGGGALGGMTSIGGMNMAGMGGITDLGSIGNRRGFEGNFSADTSSTYSKKTKAQSKKVQKPMEKNEIFRKRKDFVVPKLPSKPQMQIIDFSKYITSDLPKGECRAYGIVPQKQGKTPLKMIMYEEVLSKPLMNPEKMKKPQPENEKEEEEGDQKEKKPKSIPDKIKSKLMKAGVDEEKANLCATTCASVEEAFQNCGKEIPKKQPKPQTQNYDSGDFNIQGGLRMNGADGFLPADFNKPRQKRIRSQYGKELKFFTILVSEEDEMFKGHMFPHSWDLTYHAKEKWDLGLKEQYKHMQCEKEGALFLAIFVVNRTECNLLVTGKEGTPYAYGIYHFDMLIPFNYPKYAPKLYMRTGNKRVYCRSLGNGKYELVEKDTDKIDEDICKDIRWNPRIKESGLIELGMLNTYFARGEDNWNPDSSDLYDVGHQIFTVLMDNNILNKREDPFYQQLAGGHPQNEWCRLEILYANMRWAVIDLLENTPLGYEMLVFVHFHEVYKDILKMLDEKLEELQREPPRIEENYLSDNPEIYEYLKKDAYKAFKNIRDEFNGIVQREHFEDDPNTL